ncbi:Aim19 protein [Saccharomycopsis crataegensis]|mgnify:CR=1 FL=1|uniref:Aim19 protein n=1 Tax=Saccharomycopsis crataegensis TaxID=43959 RepID=A0AAV5QIK0_9ASCO|nr:Aim19 protein [Saccharomycopsis crataegensis]
MPEDIQKAIQKTEGSGMFVYNRLYEYTLTPYPAWLFSSSLFVSPLVAKSQIVAKPGVLSPSRLFPSRTNPESLAKLVRVGPSNISVVLFGAASALGGYMIYDDDCINGAGFTMTWSTLYLLSNGRNTINAIKYGRVWPVLLTVGAVSNAVLYGKRFIWRN